MGVGKSTIGKKLANLLDYNFVDTDDLFEKKYKLSIDTFFSKYDEKLFREFENKILKSTFSLNETIIATGGGTPCHHYAMEDINTYGTSVYLHMSVSGIQQRLLDAKKPRPLVKDKNNEELLVEIERLLSSRIEFYEKADLQFDASHPDIELLKRQLKVYLNSD